MNSKLIRNERGSAAVFFLSVLPLFFIIFITLAFTGYIIQLKSRVRATCINQSIEIQKDIISSEKKLFALNPLSTALRVGLGVAAAEIVASAGNPLIIADATLRIKSIREQQKNLDKLQKSIIKYAEIKTKISSAKIMRDIYQHFSEMGSIWAFYLSATNAIYPRRLPQVAVEPDFDDIAPNYGLTKDYKTTQQLVLSWHHSYRTKQTAQQTIDKDFDFAFSCGAGPNQKGNKWLVEIKGDKF